MWDRKKTRSNWIKPVMRIFIKVYLKLFLNRMYDRKWIYILNTVHNGLCRQTIFSLDTLNWSDWLSRLTVIHEWKDDILYESY